jgi:hypothetical protein
MPALLNREADARPAWQGAALCHPRLLFGLVAKLLVEPPDL